nr:nuclear transport factor 2 family protein [Sphingomonas sp. CDS-1]
MIEDPDFSFEIRSSCSALIADYAYYVDHREFDKAVALFTEDGRIERPDLISDGRKEIEENWASRPTSVVTCHICSPPSFREIAQDRATAVTYFTLYHLHHTGSGPAPMGDPIALGEFHDVFVTTQQGWRFKSRKVIAVLKRN